MTQFVNNFLINFNITNILYILASFIYRNLSVFKTSSYYF